MTFNARQNYRSDPAFRGNYWKARQQAFSRSEGLCQSCGLQRAEEAHHWAFAKYPSGDQVTGNDLIAVCKTCHKVITALRRLIRACIDRSQIEDEFELMIFDFQEDIHDKAVEVNSSQDDSISVTCCRCGHKFLKPLTEFTSQNTIDCPSCAIPIITDLTDSQAWNLLHLSVCDIVNSFLID